MTDLNTRPGAGFMDSALGRTAVCVRVGGILFGLALVSPGLAVAQTQESEVRYAAPMPLRDIALELSNPVTSIGNFAWDTEYFTFQGDLPGSDDQTGTRMVFTQTWPFKLDNGKQLLLRLTVPVNGDLPNWKPESYLDYRDFIIRKVPITEPRIDPSAGEFGYGHDHLADIAFDFGYGGVSEDGIISMISLANVLPTSEDGSGARNQWLIGPEFALGKVTDWGQFGVRAKHLADIGGEGEQELGRLATNETTFQLFFAYSFGNGWQVESNPVILYDWEAVSGNEWVVPVGAGISKTFRAGRRPMKLGLEIQHFVVSPDRFGPEWLVQLKFIPFVGDSYK